MIEYFRLNKATGERERIEEWQFVHAVAGDYGPLAAAEWKRQFGHRIDVGGWYEYQTEERQEAP